ncbi:hypothetical protein [Microbacterium sp. ZXX196]|uniref:hypothetical protein n=1 Tax=Microbacterium sp. ZXX196 TaxID=2609291 RepID=UPI0012B7765D|nr:hypothetical protein [Microbacterium sp. ZXX196]MTE24338.1 hypothetical protein [Microbacterium sp. ZXX196]
MPSPVFTVKNGAFDDFLSVYDPTTQIKTKLLFRASGNRNPVERARIMNRLLDDGADPSAEAEYGSTLLGVLEAEHDPMVDGPLLERLIAYGANVNFLERKGDRPIDYVRRMMGVRDADRWPYYKAIFESGTLNLDLPKNPRHPDGPTYRESFANSTGADRFPVLYAYFNAWATRNPRPAT